MVSLIRSYADAHTHTQNLLLLASPTQRLPCPHLHAYILITQPLPCPHPYAHTHLTFAQIRKCRLHKCYFHIKVCYQTTMMLSPPSQQTPFYFILFIYFTYFLNFRIGLHSTWTSLPVVPVGDSSPCLHLFFFRNHTTTDKSNNHGNHCKIISVTLIQ